MAYATVLSQSTHIFRERSSTHHVEMQMLHGLTSVFTAVGDHAVSVYKPRTCGNLRNRLKNFSNENAVFGTYPVRARNMCLWHYENMNGCLRINILERKYVLVLIHLRRRDLSTDDLTKNTIHRIHLRKNYAYYSTAT